MWRVSVELLCTLFEKGTKSPSPCWWPPESVLQRLCRKPASLAVLLDFETLMVLKGKNAGLSRSCSLISYTLNFCNSSVTI